MYWNDMNLMGTFKLIIRGIIKYSSLSYHFLKCYVFLDVGDQISIDSFLLWINDLIDLFVSYGLSTLFVGKKTINIL